MLKARRNGAGRRAGSTIKQNAAAAGGQGRQAKKAHAQRFGAHYPPRIKNEKEKIALGE